MINYLITRECYNTQNTSTVQLYLLLSISKYILNLEIEYKIISQFIKRNLNNGKIYIVTVYQSALTKLKTMKTMQMELKKHL